MSENPTFYRSMVDSYEWKAWVRENELNPKWDVHESMETGWMSSEHFAAFVKFLATQYAVSMLLKYRRHLTLNQNQFDALIDQFTL